MKVIFAVSTVSDGNMTIHKDPINKSKVLDNRRLFLERYGISPDSATRVAITYGGDDYRRYREVNKCNLGEGVNGEDIESANALITRQPGQALFLPLADCVGAAIFDTKQNILMLSHIGRHSLEQFGAKASVEYLISHYSSIPSDLEIWLTAAPGQQNYPLFAFDNRSFRDVVFEQLHSAGIIDKNIHDNPTDTTTDPNYYSHSEFLAGRQNDDGRYAVVAMMQL